MSLAGGSRGLYWVVWAESESESESESGSVSDRRPGRTGVRVEGFGLSEEEARADLIRQMRKSGKTCGEVKGLQRFGCLPRRLQCSAKPNT
jgi:hypothetical protein